MKDRFKTFMRFISLLRVEPFMIILAFSSYFRRTPLEVLIQDKLCRNRYNMSEEFCLELAYMSDVETGHEIKTQILSDAVKYNMYHTWITMAPGIMWSIFLGPWIDKYINGRKAIFIIGSITQALEAAMNAIMSYFFTTNVNWILVSFIPYTLSGSMTYTTAYSYVAVTTPTKYRTIRMTALEVLVAIAQPLGVYTSGKLINNTPLGGNGQLHNYGLIFSISSFGAFVAFLWAVFVINQENDKNLFRQHFGDCKGLLDHQNGDQSSEYNANTEYIHPLRLLFNINNVREIAITFAKKRPNYVRAQIWLAIGGMFWCYFIWTAPAAFLFQFVEKIYHWDAPVYTELSSIGMIANSVVIIFITPLLIKVFKLNDMILAIIGFFGSFMQLIVLALIRTPMGYFIGLVVNCTASLGPIGYKTHLSKIVEPSELGKVFTLMAVIDGFAPIMAASVFTVIFENTIDTSPGISFLILAAIAVIPILIAMIIDIVDGLVFDTNIKKIQFNIECNSNSNNNNGDNYANYDSIMSPHGTRDKRLSTYCQNKGNRVAKVKYTYFESQTTGDSGSESVATTDNTMSATDTDSYCITIDTTSDFNMYVNCTLGAVSTVQVNI
ncbi:unnamed protein product [Oppiella nova]|uniref:Uncharacterized protein n=1 Tax=Oppiella nova TaxID=334625 RepID=A0A7R9LY38_9ACAR|nr:unnamed protein product [Oppiella nova]CAG2167426.1 unnamed protein product [Oppiella nova]